MDTESLNTWNSLAELYQEKFMDLNFYDASYSDFCDKIQSPSASVLDLACGPGNISAKLLSLKPDLIIFGCDMAEEMVKLARKNNPNATYEVRDMRDLVSLNKSFDAVICGFGIPFLDPNECRVFFKDISHICNSEAVFYLSFVEGEESDSGFKTGSSGHRTYFNYHRLSSITESLQSAGFELIQKYIVEYPLADGNMDKHTVLICKKNIQS